jgi:hypothetical protein
VKIGENRFGKYLCIPVDSWLRSQFNTIEEFATLNMNIPAPLGQEWRPRNDQDTPYGSLWAGPKMAISFSNWCQFLRQDAEYLTEINQCELGDGTFDVAISVSGIFYGSHQDNKVVSLTLFIQSLLYKPKQDSVDTIIDEILQGADAKPAADSKHGKRRRKK